MKNPERTKFLYRDSLWGGADLLGREAFGQIDLPRAATLLADKLDVTLLIDQSGLNPLGNLNPTRIAAGNQVTLQGGGLTLTPGGSVDSSATINLVTLVAGATTFDRLTA